MTESEARSERMRMMWSGAVLTAVLAFAQADVEREIRRQDARRLEALTKGDVGALEQMLARELVYTHASGWRQTRAEFLASIRSGELRYHTFTVGETRIQVYGDTVVETGRAAARVTSKGEELDVKLLFWEVYVKRDGRWQLAAWQSTRPAG